MLGRFLDVFSSEEQKLKRLAEGRRRQAEKRKINEKVEFLAKEGVRDTSTLVIRREYETRQSDGMMRRHSLTVRSQNKVVYSFWESIDPEDGCWLKGISTYIPGEWERELDELYEKVSLAKPEKDKEARIRRLKDNFGL